MTNRSTCGVLLFDDKGPAFYIKNDIQCILTYPNPFVQAKKDFVRITENFRYVKYIEKYITESSITIWISLKE